MNDFSGTVVFSRGGKIVASRNYGMANYELQVPHRPQTKYRICSVGKMFTEAAVLLLEKQGKLKTTDLFSKYVRGYPNGDKFSLRQLLDHRSGLGRDLVNFEKERALPHTTAELVEFTKQVPPVGAPGERYVYSNNGYRLLAHVIEKASGRSYGTFVEEAVLEPLGMRDTREERPHQLIPDRASGYVPGRGYGTLEHPEYLDLTNYSGAGSFTATVGDLHRWAQSLPLPGEEPNLVSAKDAKAKRRVFGHDGLGHGFLCLVYRYPDENACLVCAGNVESGPFDALHRDLPAILFGEPYQKPTLRSSGVAMAEGVAKRYVGRYEIAPGRVMEVRLDGKELLLGAGDGFQTLIPQSATEFFLRLKYATVRFVRQADQVTGIQWLQDGREFWCKKLP
jgi:CubicO group peptidase (beta-lactamase class C family)